jgi:hypothetical protein
MVGDGLVAPRYGIDWLTEEAQVELRPFDAAPAALDRLRRGVQRGVRAAESSIDAGQNLFHRLHCANDSGLGASQRVITHNRAGSTDRTSGSARL